MIELINVMGTEDVQKKITTKYGRLSQKNLKVNMNSAMEKWTYMYWQNRNKHMTI